MLQRLRTVKGFTLVELIIVLAILAILAALTVPRAYGIIEHARQTADKATVRTLNSVTTLYSMRITEQGGDIFEGFDTDEQRMEQLVEKRLLNALARPQFQGAQFVWMVEEQLWVIYNGETMVPLSPLGSSFQEISSGMIGLINQRYSEKNAYGRTWGDYAYTDIGLDPNDWKSPVLHIYFKPGGSTLRIRPEEGYQFAVKDMNGNTRTLSYSLNWDLVYSAPSDQWYYHAIAENNLINISTLEVLR